MNDRPTDTREFRGRLLPDHALETAPKPVVEANAAAMAAIDQLHRLRPEARQAQIEAQNAPAADVEATKQALDQGKPAPKPSVERKQAAAEEAARKAQAAEALAREKFAALDHVVREAHREWIDAERTVIARDAEKARAALDQAAAAFEPIEQHAGTLAFLYTYDPTRPKTMSPAIGSRLLADTDASVPRTPSNLLAALGSLSGEYLAAHADDGTAIEHDAQQHANRLARKALRHRDKQLTN